MKNKIIWIVSLITAALLFLSVFYYFKKQTRNAVELLAENDKMINILLAGNNAYNNNRHTFYAVVSLNPENNRIGVTFIPPDFRIRTERSSDSFIRIDEADINSFKSLSASLQDDLKLSIPFYVVLYSPDVERFVDLIEGVELYILDELKIPGIHFGLNYFDGNKLNQYINSVEENSIYKKYDRIQDILLTLYYNRNKYERFINAEFISEGMKRIKTNLLPQEIMSLAQLLYKKEADLTCTIMPGFFTKDGFYIVDETAYKIYKNNFLKKLIVNNYPEQPVKIKILNGTDITGLARRVRRKFVSEGFNVVEFGTSPYPTFDKTLIINRKGDIGPVRKVSELIGVNRIYHSVDSTQLNNVLVILGFDMARH